MGARTPGCGAKRRLTFLQRIQCTLIALSAGMLEQGGQRKEGPAVGLVLLTAGDGSDGSPEAQLGAQSPGSP